MSFTFSPRSASRSKHKFHAITAVAALGILSTSVITAPEAFGVDAPGFGRLPNPNVENLLGIDSGEKVTEDAGPLTPEQEQILAKSPLNSLPLSPQRAANAGSLVSKEVGQLMVNDKAWDAKSFRYHYNSTDSMERPSVDTALYIEPNEPWTGEGPRPVVAIAPGTQGSAEQCDPSLSTQKGVQVRVDPFDMVAPYEVLPIIQNLEKGAAVVIVDHHRNSAGNQEYVDNISSAQSLLDGVTAARELGIPDDAPIGIYGYSQGGSAAAAAAERAGVYAPELNVVATSAGGPPSDLTKVLEQIDGSTLTAAIALAINSVLDKDPDLRAAVDQELSDDGRELLNSVGSYCIGGLALHHAFETTDQYIAAKTNLVAIMEKYYPIKTELKRQRVGNFRPNAPVFLYSGLHDDVIPINQVRMLRDDWIALGADLDYYEDPTPAVAQKSGLNHVAPLLNNLGKASDYLWAHFPAAQTPLDTAKAAINR